MTGELTKALNTLLAYESPKREGVATPGADELARQVFEALGTWSMQIAKTGELAMPYELSLQLQAVCTDAAAWRTAGSQETRLANALRDAIADIHHGPFSHDFEKDVRVCPRCGRLAEYRAALAAATKEGHG